MLASFDGVSERIVCILDFPIRIVNCFGSLGGPCSSSITERVLNRPSELTERLVPFLDAGRLFNGVLDWIGHCVSPSCDQEKPTHEYRRRNP